MNRYRDVTHRTTTSARNQSVYSETKRSTRLHSLAGFWLSATITCNSVAENSPEPRDYSGTYLLVQQTVTVSELPVVADVVATTRAISIQRLEQAGDRLRGTGPLCSLELESSSSLVETTLPDAFRRALPPIVTDARLIQEGSTVRFDQAPQLTVVGARLKNAKTDPLPANAEDPRVFDQDRDGKPGMTVRISGIISGEVYVAQRGTSSLSGSLRDGIFAGQIRFRNEQRILGATSSFLEGGPEAKPDLKRSKFWLVPVNPATTCKEAARLAARWR